MVVSIGSGKVSANITGSAVISGQSPISLTLLGRTNVGTIGTVPANKLWRIYYFSFCASPVSDQDYEITVNGVEVVRAYGSLDKNTQLVFPYPICIIANAGEVVALASSTSGTSLRAIIGYTEESV